MKYNSYTDTILSVVVPIYNAESTLDRCLSSLLNQSLKNIEIICIDDCSSDSSKDILLTYQHKYPDKVIYAKTDERCGPGGARNYGISLARGRYIGFVDGDDWVDSSLYSIVIEQAVEQNADIAVFGVIDEFENPSSSKIRYEYSFPNSIDHIFALHLLTRTYNNDVFISPMVCQKVYRRKFLQAKGLRFLANSYFEDDFFSFCCFLFESKIVIVPKVYYHYYQRPNSITHTFSKKHVDDLVQLTADLKSVLINENIWKANQQDYYAFCNKCIRSAINALFIAEPNIQIQKKYILYLATELQAKISLDEWLDYMDIQAIKRLFAF